MKQRLKWAAPLRGWFTLSTGEQLALAGIVAILLIGVLARHHHLKSLEAESYTPIGLTTSR